MSHSSSEFQDEYPVIPQTTYEFFEDLVDCIEGAKTEVGIMAMQFEEGPATGEILDKIISAHHRGVKSHVDFDPYVQRMTRVWNRDVMHGLPLWCSQDRRERDHSRILTEKRLRSLGDLGILHIPKQASPLHPKKRFGVNHIKLAYADDAAWLMTGNLTDPDIYLPGWRGDPGDYQEGWDASKIIGMHNSAVRFVHPALVRTVKQIANAACEGRLSTDQVPVDLDGYELFTTNGRRGITPTYQRALEMIDRAKEQILFITQYPPDGPLLDRLLAKTKEEVFVSIPIQPKGDHRLGRFPYSLMNAKFRAESLPARKDFFNVEERILPSHNKALIVDEKEILYGTDNLLYSLMRLVGSKEVSLWSNDEAFVRGMAAMLFSLEFGGGFHISGYDTHDPFFMLGE